MTLHVELDELHLAHRQDIVQARHLGFDRRRVGPGLTEAIVAGIKERSLKHRASVCITRGALKWGDIESAIRRAILTKDRKKIRLGLKSENATGVSDQLREEQGIEPDIGADIDDLHSLPHQPPHKLSFFGPETP